MGLTVETARRLCQPEQFGLTVQAAPSVSHTSSSVTRVALWFEDQKSAAISYTTNTGGKPFTGVALSHHHLAKNSHSRISKGYLSL
jgi:hypothetical protein